MKIFSPIFPVSSNIVFATCAHRTRCFYVWGKYGRALTGIGLCLSSAVGASGSRRTGFQPTKRRFLCCALSDSRVLLSLCPLSSNMELFGSRPAHAFHTPATFTCLKSVGGFPRRAAETHSWRCRTRMFLKR